MSPRSGEHEPQPPQAGHALRSLLGDFIASTGWRSAGAVCLMGAAALLEGLGLLMIAPFLVLLGIGAAQKSGPTRLLIRAFEHLGLTPSVPQVLAAYVVLIGVHSFICTRRDILSAELHDGFLDRLRLQLFTAIGSAEWAFLARTRSAEFSHSLTTDLGRVSQAVQSTLQGTATAIVALAYMGVALRLSWPLALRLSWPLALLTFAVGGLFLIAIRNQYRQAHMLGRHLSLTTQRLHAEISEFLAGLKLAKSHNAEAEIAGRFASTIRESRGHLLRFAHQQAHVRAWSRIGAAVALALLVWLATAFLGVAPATVLVLALIFSRLFPILSQLQQLSGRLLHSLPAYIDFMTMCAQCRAAAEPQQKREDYPLLEALELHDIHYRHTPAGAEVLRGISLKIPVRSMTAIVGPSGAGKSTLADLLAGLIEPSSGNLTVDSHDVDDRRAWRQGVAYVPQETFLFNATVRENLLWGAANADDALLWRVLELAAAEEFVRALPHGLETTVGERGIRLSGGERQRLAIARALLRNPRLLVLDEATSALDSENECRIQSALARLHGHLTIVVVAHRLTTVRAADQIVEVNHGTIAQRGDYESWSAKAESSLARHNPDALAALLVS